MSLVDNFLYAWHGSRPPAPVKDAVIANMPQEILLQIAENLPTLLDRINLGLTSSCLYPKVMPSVYANTELDGVEQCKNTLGMLIRMPNIARHVCKLVVHPDRFPPTKNPLLTFAQEYCNTVSTLVAAAARNMDALHTFVWDADAYIPDDLMWTELREWCPHLRNIGTTFVRRIPSPSSDLFAFNDLEGFSLVYKSTYYTPENFWIKENEPVFKKLWDMLIKRCPNLRSLAIEGDWDEPLYERHLLDGRWPCLRTLRLGPIKFDFNWPTQDSTLPLLKFIERHPTIEELSLANVRADLTRLSPYALPKLKKLRGYMDDLRGLGARRVAAQDPQDDPEPDLQQQGEKSKLSETLDTLVLLDPMRLRELTPLAVSSMLVGLQALTSLTIVFSLQNGYDSNGVFRTIVSACPHLRHLDLTCTCKPSFHLDAFSRTLRNLTKLRTLSLTTVKVPGDEPMQAGAARIALSNPRLTKFAIAYIPANKPIRRGYLPPQPLEIGRFVLVCDIYGIPVSLLVWESWFRFKGMGARTSRRSVYELRPSGHPDAERKGWWDTMAERSPAGEEARLLLFSASLLSLAMWGIAVSVISGMSRVTRSPAGSYTYTL